MNELFIKILINKNGEICKYAVAKVDVLKGIKVKPGDWSFDADNKIFQANQSNCIWCEWKIVGIIKNS